MSHEAAITAAGGRFLGEAHGTVWFTDPETQSTLALPSEEVTADNIAMTLLRSRRSFRQEQFRLLIEGLQDYAILMLDQSGSIVSWNTGAERIYGYPPQEIIGKTLTTLFFPAEQEKMVNILSLASREGRYESEMWKRRRDGSAIWGDIVITALRDEAEQVRGYSYVCRDITRRHNDQQRQRARLCVTRALAENSASVDVAVSFLDCVCEHLEWEFAEYWTRINQEDRVMLRALHCAGMATHDQQRRLQTYRELPLEQVFPGSIATITHPVVLQFDSTNFTLGQVCFNGDKAQTALVFPLRDPNIVCGWVLFGQRHRREPNAEEIEVIEDLTHLLNRYLQQERAEKQLQKLTQQVQEQAGLLDRILNASPDLVVLVDREGRYTYVNSKAAATLGLEPGFMIGKYPWELGLPEDRVGPLEQERKQVVETGVPIRSETSFPVLTGLRDFEYIMNPIWGSEGKVESVVVSGRDITERKRLEERLHLVLEQLPAVVWTTDDSLHFTSFLGAGLRALKFPPEQVLGMSVAEFCRGEEFEAATMEAHEKALKGQRIAFRSLWKQRTFDVWVQPLRGVDGSIHGVIGLALDITEQTPAEAAAFGPETELDMIRHSTETRTSAIELLRRYLRMTNTILMEMASRLRPPEEQERREAIAAMLEEVHSISRQLDELSGPASRVTTDAS